MTPPPDKPQRPRVQSLPSWRRYAGMGSELAGAICGLTLFGYWIDRRYGTGMKGTIIGATIGVVGGMYNFIRQALALSRTMQKVSDDYKDGVGNAGHGNPDRPADH